MAGILLPPPPLHPIPELGAPTPHIPGRSQPQWPRSQPVSPSPGLTSSPQGRRILRARLLAGLLLLRSCLELAGCKSGLVWQPQSSVTVQSKLSAWAAPPQQVTLLSPACSQKMTCTHSGAMRLEGWSLLSSLVAMPGSHRALLPSQHPASYFGRSCSDSLAGLLLVY